MDAHDETVQGHIAAKTVAEEQQLASARVIAEAEIDNPAFARKMRALRSAQDVRAMFI